MANFERGYSKVREKLRSDRGSRFVMSCTNCEFYYQACGDKEECCQNNGVLEYDVIVDSDRVYCLQWKPVSHKKQKSSEGKEKVVLFRKNRG
jgi:hypothetical protein